MKMDSLSLKLCDVQGRLFSLSSKKGFDSESFVPLFMRSDLARHFDLPFDHNQWAGENYLLDALLDECGFPILKEGVSLGEEKMYWIGYLYRYWHFFENLSSKQIYRIAPFKIMKQNYLLFHTLGPDIAILDLKEICYEKKSRHLAGVRDLQRSL